MPLDANIYGNIQQPKFDNALAQYGNLLAIQNAGNQNRLADLQYTKAARDMAEEEAGNNALRNYFSGDRSLESVNALAKTSPKSYMAVTKYMDELKEKDLKRRIDEAKLVKDETDRIGAKLLSVQTPEQLDSVIGELAKHDPASGPLYRQTIAAHLASGVPASEIAQRIGASINQHANQYLTSIAPQLEAVNTGGNTAFIQKNSRAPGFGQPAAPSIAHTPTPGDLMTDARAREQGDLNRALQKRGQDIVDARAKQTNEISAGRNSREDADNLRKEFEGRQTVKSYREVIPIAEAARAAPDTRSGDIQLAYAVGKILDPNSVVREGELKLVGNAATLPEQLTGQIRTLVMGNGRLTPKTRKELQAVLDSAVGQRKNAYDVERKSVEDIVNRRGYNPNDVFIAAPQSGGGWKVEEVK